MRKILFFILIGLAFSCKDKNSNNVVPNPATAACATLKSNLKISSSSPNLNNQPDTITASFSNAVQYSVLIQGQTSGATKTYSGFSDTVGIIWKGESDNSRFFVAEAVNVVLSYTCGTSIKQTINIQPYDWTKDGVLISDFDGQGYVSNTTSINVYNATGWTSEYVAPNLISNFKITSSPLQAVQKTNYLTIQGQAGSTGYAGDFYFNPPASFPDSNPQNVYFNAFINGGQQNSTLIIAFKDGSTNYFYNLPISWQGWKLVSIQMSDFKNNLTEASATDLSYVSVFDIFLYTASRTSGAVEANFDYLILTKDKPLFQ